MSFLASLAFSSHAGCSPCASDAHLLDLFLLHAETWLTCRNTGWVFVSQWTPPTWDSNKRPGSQEFDGATRARAQPASLFAKQFNEKFPHMATHVHIHLSLWQHEIGISPSICIPHFSRISWHVPPLPHETGRTNTNVIFLNYRLENLSPWESDFPNFW